MSISLALIYIQTIVLLYIAVELASMRNFTIKNNTKLMEILNLLKHNDEIKTEFLTEEEEAELFRHSN